MAKVIYPVLQQTAKSVAKQVHEYIQTHKVSKANADDPNFIERIDLSLLEQLADDQTVMFSLEDSHADTETAILTAIGVDQQEELFNTINEDSQAYARDRAAELVGKQIDSQGNIIDNPNPAWSITETTREQLRGTLSDMMEQGSSLDEISQTLQDDYAFSEERSMMIARTETMRAGNQGALAGYEQAANAGVTVLKEWLVGEGCCDECAALGDLDPIPWDEDFEGEDGESYDAPPAHPNCRCTTSPVVDESSTSEDQPNIPADDGASED